jgi:hypothetical protein
MTGLINPSTGRTIQHERYLELLETWLGDERFVHTLLRERLLGPVELVGLLKKLLVERFGDEGEGLTEQSCGMLIKAFVQSRKVRRQAARVVRDLHGVPIKQALRDLREMKG